jgi:hypothetical protein
MGYSDDVTRHHRYGGSTMTKKSIDKAAVKTGMKTKAKVITPKPIKKPLDVMIDVNLTSKDRDERKDLEIALRLIKMRWEGLDEHDRTATGATHGIYFTPGQLMMLNRLAEHWNKVAESLKVKS